MVSGLAAVDMASIRDVECSLRKELLSSPQDLESRIKISWCLLLRAAYQAGQEAESSTRRGPHSQDALPSTEILPTNDRSSAMLLSECLRHASIVKQLGVRSSVQAQVRTLQMVIDFVGCSDLHAIAESHVAGVLERIAADITAESASTQAAP